MYDYVGGKMDWLSFGLPHEGEALLAGDALSSDVPTCRADEQLGAVRHRLRAPFCVVLNHEGVVVGAVGDEAFRDPDDRRIEDVLSFAVTTVRPSEDLEALTGRMEEAGTDSVLVTSSDGKLLGRLTLEGATQALGKGSSAV